MKLRCNALRAPLEGGHEVTEVPPETLRRSQPLTLHLLRRLRISPLAPFRFLWFLATYNVPSYSTQYLTRLHFCMMASEDVPLHFQDAKSASMLWPVSYRRSRSNRIKTIGLSVIALFFFFLMLQSSSTVRTASCSADML